MAYYVFDDNNCKYESMTSEQILSAIQEAIKSGRAIPTEEAVVTKIKEQNKNRPLSFWVGSQAEYNAVEEKDKNCFYIVTDGSEREDLKAKIDEHEQKISNLAKKTTSITNIDAYGITGLFCFIKVGALANVHGYFTVDQTTYINRANCLNGVSKAINAEYLQVYSGATVIDNREASVCVGNGKSFKIGFDDLNGNQMRLFGGNLEAGKKYTFSYTYIAKG